VPYFKLIDADGREFSSKQQLQGKVWVANFIFTNCMGPCPRMSSQVRQVQRSVAEKSNVRLVSFTIDPKRDTPEVLKGYAKRFGAEAGLWFFLTGEQSELNRLSMDTFRLGPVNGNLEHSTRLVLVDGKGRIRGYYDSSYPESIQELLDGIQKLSKETA
jgi:protein SCO1/2